MYKKGDKVLVWSLQSFFHGGFLCGEPAFVRQDQNGSASVILCVIRNMGGEYKIDTSYEVYTQQIVPIGNGKWGAKKRLKKLRKYVMNRGRYHEYKGKL